MLPLILPDGHGQAAAALSSVQQGVGCYPLPGYGVCSRWAALRAVQVHPEPSKSLWDHSLPHTACQSSRKAISLSVPPFQLGSIWREVLAPWVLKCALCIAKKGHSNSFSGKAHHISHLSMHFQGALQKWLVLGHLWNIIRKKNKEAFFSFRLR